MAKLEKTRLILKDYENHYWRLCHFSHGYDKFGEPYLKIMFPGFAEGKVTLTKQVKFREKDGSLFIPKNAKSVPNNSSEVTYHYGGVLNLKGGKGYASQNRRFPKLRFAKKPVLMCRYLLKDFSSCKRVKSTDTFDLILDKYSLPRILGFYASYGNSPVIIEREDGRSHYFTCHEDSQLLITVIEYPINNLQANGLMTNEDPYAWLKGTSRLSQDWYHLKSKLKNKWPRIFYGLK